MKTVDEQIAIIKAKMPETYASILAKSEKVGRLAFSQVRRGLSGKPNCFYAFESGHVVGTPFNLTDVMQTTAYYMVAFGLKSAVIWWDQVATEPQGDCHGTH